MACDTVLANTQSEMCSPEAAIVGEIFAVTCLIWWAAVWVLCCTLWLSRGHGKSTLGKSPLKASR